MRMRREVPWLTLLLLGLIGVGVWVKVRRPRPVTRPAPVLAGEPKTMLWAWETPEDLRGLDAGRAGVAFLARELLLDTQTTVRPRRQPLAVPQGAWLTAVVRIETGPRFRPPDADVAALAGQIVTATGLPQVRALQIDFDAAGSERGFYAALLREVRRELPAGYPLSITALTSWCGARSWLQGLPIDEAVPMFFRMGGPAATRAQTPRSLDVIAEPLCAGSAGVATDEVWPALRGEERVYVFRTGAWTKEDIANVNAKGYMGLKAALR